MIIKNIWKINMADDKSQVLFDLNIILDVLLERVDFYDFSARLLAYAETGVIQGWLAAHSVTTLFYLIAKDKSTDQARVTMTSLLQFLKIAPVDQTTIEQALNLHYQDFEDAVQMTAALRVQADYLLSRNVEDFQPAPLTVIQPVELLAILKLKF
jgi:predicted nucleic acid-binding protein